MKALTIWQPHASLFATLWREYETRSWAPPKSLIGQRIAIHAAKREIDPLSIRDLPDMDFPLGVVVATAILRAAYQCRNPVGENWVEVQKSVSDGDDQVLITADRFGDFSAGRWAWLLEDIKAFERPISATGRQWLWNWTPPSLFPSTAPGIAPAFLE